MPHLRRLATFSSALGRGFFSNAVFVCVEFQLSSNLAALPGMRHSCRMWGWVFLWLFGMMMGMEDESMLFNTILLQKPTSKNWNIVCAVNSLSHSYAVAHCPPYTIFTELDSAR